MQRFEIAIKIDDENYVDSLIVSLVRQGYEVYYNKDERIVCFIASDDEVTETKRGI